MIGPVLTSEAVSEAAKSTLATWMPSILAELASRLGLDREGWEPNLWVNVPDFDSLQDTEYPLVVVSSPGLGEPRPRRQSDGTWESSWNVGAYPVVRGDDFNEVRQRVSLYTAAARVALLQHGIFGKSPWWLDEQYDAGEAAEARTLGVGVFMCHVRLSDAVLDTAGPGTPPAPPSYLDPAQPAVATVTTILQPKP